MKVEANRQEGYQLLQDGLQELAWIESEGIRIDVRRLAWTKERLQGLTRSLRRELEEDKTWVMWRRRFGSKANLNSRDQLSVILHDELGHEVKKTTEGGRPMMDEESLADLDHPFVNRLGRLYKYDKALKTFLTGIEREVINGLLHPVFNLHIARSYRSSSDSPNFQNFPVRDKEISKVIRSLFIARPGGVLVENDFKGIEVGVSACYHKDRNFISYITTPGKDMHRDMAAQIYKLKPEQVDKDIRYCNTVESPVWMGDFSFKPIGEVRVGDVLIGWTRDCEKPLSRTAIKRGRVKGKRGNKLARKRLQRSVVTAISRRKAEVVKVVLESGRIIRCTADHLWLSGKMQYKGVLKQLPFGKYENKPRGYYTRPVEGAVLSFVTDPVESLPVHLHQRAGWLGGMFDGEGSFSTRI